MPQLCRIREKQCSTAAHAEEAIVGAMIQLRLLWKAMVGAIATTNHFQKAMVGTFGESNGRAMGRAIKYYLYQL